MTWLVASHGIDASLKTGKNSEKWHLVYKVPTTRFEPETSMRGEYCHQRDCRIYVETSLISHMGQHKWQEIRKIGWQYQRHVVLYQGSTGAHWGMYQRSENTSTRGLYPVVLYWRSTLFEWRCSTVLWLNQIYRTEKGLYSTAALAGRRRW